MHFFENWKLSKYKKQQKNKLLQKLLDEIESQAVLDILDDVNSREAEIIVSDDEEDEEEARVPVDGVDGARVLIECVVCRREDGDGEQLTWAVFECGHQYCDPCAEHLLANGSVCPQARCELKGKRRIYHNVHYVVKAPQRSRPLPRILTQDERRQENVILMRGRGHNQQQHDLESSDEEEEEEVAAVPGRSNLLG